MGRHRGRRVQRPAALPAQRRQLSAALSWRRFGASCMRCACVRARRLSEAATSPVLLSESRSPPTDFGSRRKTSWIVSVSVPSSCTPGSSASRSKWSVTRYTVRCSLSSVFSNPSTAGGFRWISGKSCWTLAEECQHRQKDHLTAGSKS
jgi:hypothetical protein